jgi:hypothetical protein
MGFIFRNLVGIIFATVVIGVFFLSMGGSTL